MMNFRTIKANLVTVLGAAAGGAYQVEGYQQQGKAAVRALDSQRIVQVFFRDSQLPPDQAGITGPFQTDTTYAIELTVAARATGDLTALNDENSTPAELQAALAAVIPATANADTDFDELVDSLFQTLLDGNNLDLGATGPPWVMSGRWLPGVQKDPVKTEGEYVVLTGRIMYNCLIDEIAPGATTTPAAGTGAFDTTLDLDGDDVEKTGVTI